MMMLRSRTTKAVKTVGCDSACGKLVFFCTPFSALARFQSQRVTASRRDWHRSSGAARGSALHDLQGRVPAPAEGPTAGSHGVAPDTLPPRCACDSMLHRHCQNGPPTSGPGRGRSSSHSRQGALGTDADEVRSSRRAQHSIVRSNNASCMAWGGSVRTGSLGMAVNHSTTLHLVDQLAT